MSHDHHHSQLHKVSERTLNSGLRRRLLWAFLINLVFLIVEVIGGIISGSIALLADAGHMLSDVISLGMAFVISMLMMKPANQKQTYGYGRLEVLSGLINGLVLWGVVVYIGIESIQRMMQPQEISTTIMMIIGILGLLANLGSAAVLFKNRSDDLNLRQAFLHLSADAAGSVGVILAAVGVLVGGWYWLDPLASILIAVLILWSSISLVKDSIHIILEGSPPDINLDKLRESLRNLDSVVEIHDLHVWLVSSGEPVLTAHLVRKSQAELKDVLNDAFLTIKNQTNIDHITLQVEDDGCKGYHF